MPGSPIDPLPSSTLPEGIRARIIEGVNGLDMHILEAGDEDGERPTVLLLHGFPDLAFCWRRVMPLLAAGGYHVIAPDQRGYGRTTPEPVAYDSNLAPYSIAVLATDMVALVGVLNRKSVAAVIGHDFGSIVAGYCALARPDMFEKLILVGTPFGGAPALNAPLRPSFLEDPVHNALLRLPQPRKHYQLYYCGPDANHDMWRCPQGMKDFLRGYYHQKSADWPHNNPQPLQGWTAEELARMPHYYCMPAALNMAQIAAASMPDSDQIADCRWLTDDDLATVAAEFERTGFQGPLQWYRSAASGVMQRNLALFAGRQVDVPALFVAGRVDWGAYQVPGSVDAVRHRLCKEPVPIHFIEDAGHWLQQEQPERLAEITMPFLDNQQDSI